jgi:hypothetical protein
MFPHGNPRRFDWFVWKGWGPDRKQDLHTLRDGAAFAELVALLQRCGYEYGDAIFNFPDPAPAHRPADDLTGDLLVMTTRPPLDDDPQTDRHPIRCTDSALEREIRAAMRPFFATCLRARVQISTALAHGGSLPADKLNRRVIDFYTYKKSLWATYQKLGPSGKEVEPADSGRTAGYLVYVPALPSGPALLVAFGMGGNDTYLWCRLLREHLYGSVSRILQAGKAHFLMAELSPRPDLVQAPAVWTARGLRSIAKGWDYEVLIDADL